jgi:hypothetical protein
LKKNDLLGKAAMTSPIRAGKTAEFRHRRREAPDFLPIS